MFTSLRDWVTVGIATVVIAACSASAQNVTDDTEALNALLSDFDNFELSMSPMEAGQKGDMDAAGRMPDVSPEADRKALAAYGGFQDRLSGIDRDELSPEDRLNYDLFEYVLDRNLTMGALDQSRIPFTNDSGFFSMPGYIGRQTRIETADEAEAYLRRLSDTDRYMDDQIANMRRGIDTGYTAPAMIVPGVIDSIRTMAETPATQQSLYLPVAQLPERLQGLGYDTRAEAIISSEVIPAYQRLLAFMENEYLPAARPSPGISSIPGGAEQYEQMVKYYTTLDLTPDEVHQIGLNEVARIRAEMEEVIAETGFEGSFAEFLEFLRTDPQFYVDTPEQLLKEASWIAKKIDGKMPEYFGTLPRLSYGVLPVPDEMAPNYTTGRYWGGDPDAHRAGNYMVNTYDLSARPLYNLPALTLHEGVPGHHHQIALTQEQQGVPKFRQDLYPHAFGEGWGLYTEKLGKEMGIYETPYQDFGRLTYEMWRACRLVVDTGIHWNGWTREQAEACFIENSALSRHNIRTEVDRYISWPGQALAYKIGELKIWELRERAEAELGKDFDLREFHDAVLVNGAVPLSILEERIDAWIESQK